MSSLQGCSGEENMPCGTQGIRAQVCTEEWGNGRALLPSCSGAGRKWDFVKCPKHLLQALQLRAGPGMAGKGIC